MMTIYSLMLISWSALTTYIITKNSQKDESDN